MARNQAMLFVLAAWLIAAAVGTPCLAQADAPLPAGVKAVWDLDKAWREKTPTRERVCLNGLWRWQPAAGGADAAPADRWGYFKVPGSWPGITDYMQKDCQTVYAHPAWKDEKLGGVTAAWYQRELTVPGDWAGRRIVRGGKPPGRPGAGRGARRRAATGPARRGRRRVAQGGRTHARHRA
jgi:hypothetical protein